MKNLFSKSVDPYNTIILLTVVAVFFLLQQLSISSDYSHLNIFGLQLPKLCFLGQLTSLGCPFCGITRSLHFCIMGRFVEGLQINFMGVALFSLLALQIPLRAVIILRPQIKLNTRKIDSSLCSTFLYLALIRWIALLITQFPSGQFPISKIFF